MVPDSLDQNLSSVLESSPRTAAAPGLERDRERLRYRHIERDIKGIENYN